jgi:hypothetical protein
MKKLLFLSLLSLLYNYSNAPNNSSNFTHEEIDSLVNISDKKAQFKNAIKYSKIGQKKVLDTVTKEDSLYASYTAAIVFFHHRLDKYTVTDQSYKCLFRVCSNLS